MAAFETTFPRFNNTCGKFQSVVILSMNSHPHGHQSVHIKAAICCVASYAEVRGCSLNALVTEEPSAHKTN